MPTSVHADFDGSAFNVLSFAAIKVFPAVLVMGIVVVVEEILMGAAQHLIGRS
jgi:hypothetical protein